MGANVFSVPVFLITFRESLETAIIVSILLAFLKQTLGGPGSDPKVYRKLVRQVWFGTVVGFFICLIIAAAIIGTFYSVGRDVWSKNEGYWEGSFALFASVIITVMGAALLRIGKMQEKWRVKIAAAIEAPLARARTAAGGGRGDGRRGSWFKHAAQKYAMFFLPFITILREGIEAIMFIAGVSFSTPAKSVPLPVVIGLIAGCSVGYLLYKGGSASRLQVFLVLSSCLLYLVAAGLFSRGVGFIEQQRWANVIGGDADELGDGPGSYDISKSVWHVNCCSAYSNNSGWSFFNALLGWNNSATYGTVIAYNVYWIAVITGFLVMRYKEVKGHWPLTKARHAHARRGLTGDGRAGFAPAQEKQTGGSARETTEVA